jgi:D-alanyl-lipoteichoic acid acyltransferase DltB (MBOAT superfamily)
MSTIALAVLLLGALWHGAGWNFFIWGGLHGLYLCVDHLWQAWLGARTYHALSDGHFRDVVLGPLFLSGVALVWSSVGMR